MNDTYSYTTSTAKPITFADIRAMARMIPQRPPVDRDHCKKCGGGLADHNRHGICGPTIFDSPVCYVCTECFEALKAHIEKATGK